MDDYSCCITRKDISTKCMGTHVTVSKSKRSKNKYQTVQIHIFLKIMILTFISIPKSQMVSYSAIIKGKILKSGIL